MKGQGHPGKLAADPLVRFLRLMGPVPEDDGCWEYQGTKSKGYGLFGVQVQPGVWKSVKAHRFSYEAFVGPIPDGLHLDHLCRNPSCCRPDHLEPVTNRENGLRGISPAAAHAVQTHCKYGHEYTPENTMVTAGDHGFPWRECRTCYRDRARERYERRTGVTSWQCPTCDRYFPGQKALSIHGTKVHGINLSPGRRPKELAS